MNVSIDGIRFLNLLDEYPRDIELYVRDQLRSWKLDGDHSGPEPALSIVELRLPLQNERPPDSYWREGQLDLFIGRLVNIERRVAPGGRLENVEVDATLEIVVDELGKAKDVVVLDINDEKATQRVIENVERWNFPRGYKNGKPTPYITTKTTTLSIIAN